MYSAKIDVGDEFEEDASEDAMGVVNFEKPNPIDSATNEDRRMKITWRESAIRDDEPEHGADFRAKL